MRGNNFLAVRIKERNVPGFSAVSKGTTEKWTMMLGLILNISVHIPLRASAFISYCCCILDILTLLI